MSKPTQMEGLKHIAKIREYCDYLEEHLLNVGKAWKILQEKCKDMNFVWDDHLFWTIDEMIRDHDLSKMSHAEFIPYQQQFFWAGDEKPSKDNPAFAVAWENHKQKNPHHWENWTGLGEGKAKECHCVCMVADWMAMGMRFGDTAEQFYERKKDEIKLPDWAVRFIREIFERL